MGPCICSLRPVSSCSYIWWGKLVNQDERLSQGPKVVVSVSDFGFCTRPLPLAGQVLPWTSDPTFPRNSIHIICLAVNPPECVTMPVSRTPAWLQGSALPSAPRCPIIRGIEQISPKNPKATSLTDSTSDARPDLERSGRQGTNQELPKRTQYKECHIMGRALRGEIDPING